MFENPEHTLFFLAQLERYVDIQEARLLCEHPELGAHVLEQIQEAKEAFEETDEDGAPEDEATA